MREFMGWAGMKGVTPSQHVQPQLCRLSRWPPWPLAHLLQALSQPSLVLGRDGGVQHSHAIGASTQLGLSWRMR